MYSALFGVTSGAYIGLTPVVLVDILGLQKLTNALGLLSLFQGIALIIGPPIIGKYYRNLVFVLISKDVNNIPTLCNSGGLYDAIGNYDSGFYLCGAMIYISGIMLFALPWMKRRRRKRGIKKCQQYKNVCNKSENDTWTGNFVGTDGPSQIKVFCISKGQDWDRSQFEDQMHRGGRELF